MDIMDVKDVSRGYSNDMSPKAIMKRLEIVNELYQFGKFLSTAKFIGRVEDLKKQETTQANSDSSTFESASASIQPSADQPRARL
jgi:hypothetical protein